MQTTSHHILHLSLNPFPPCILSRKYHSNTIDSKPTQSPLKTHSLYLLYPILHHLIIRSSLPNTSIILVEITLERMLCKLRTTLTGWKSFILLSFIKYPWRIYSLCSTSPHPIKLSEMFIQSPSITSQQSWKKKKSHSNSWIIVETQNKNIKSEVHSPLIRHLKGIYMMYI